MSSRSLTGITCKGCHKYHDIIPLSHKEASLYRVMLLNENHKSYFCDPKCYERYKEYHSSEGVISHETEIMDTRVASDMPSLDKDRDD